MAHREGAVEAFASAAAVVLPEDSEVRAVICSAGMAAAAGRPAEAAEAGLEEVVEALRAVAAEAHQEGAVVDQAVGPAA